MAEKLTIRDIACLAHVSKATVSRVLNRKPDVDPATRERILRVIHEQGFVPSSTAAGLAGGRTRVIGVFAPSLTWSFIPEILEGVAECVEKRSYDLMLYSLPQAGNRAAVLDHILGDHLTAGLIAITPGRSTGSLARLYEQGFPLVMIDDQRLPTSVPWVGADNQAGAYQAVRHLTSLGHRRIAHIMGPASYRCSLERYQGYCQALGETGLSLDPTLIAQGDFEAASGHGAALQLFALAHRPTAIFAANDHMAWGAMEAAEELNVRIPEDVALVGFDNMAISAHKRPPLTTVSQPFQDMGRCAAEVLLELLECPRSYPFSPDSGSARQSSFHSLAAPAPVRLVLETKLVVRESCGVHLVAPLPET